MGLDVWIFYLLLDIRFVELRIISGFWWSITICFFGRDSNVESKNKIEDRHFSLDITCTLFIKDVHCSKHICFFLVFVKEIDREKWRQTVCNLVIISMWQLNHDTQREIFRALISLLLQRKRKPSFSLMIKRKQKITISIRILLQGYPNYNQYCRAFPFL